MILLTLLHDNLRMLYVYSPSQKFDTIWYNKNLKKSMILKMLMTYILHDNNLEKLLKNCKKKIMVT